MTVPTTPERVDRSMSLLVDMSAAALDPAYADVAARRAAAPAPVGAAPSVRRTTWLLVLVLLALGAAMGVAAAAVRRSADAAGGTRSRLVEDVRAKTKETDQLASTAATLRKQVAAAQAQGLGTDSTGRALARRVSDLELATGQTAVKGPGLVVTLDDAPDAATDGTTDRGGQLGDGRVYDRDLQDVVNALWAAGAEAVAINGQRLTSLTAIRSAGEAVLVDFRPLSPPYRISAVGDVDAMQPAFADSKTARRFATYTSLYGLVFETRRAGSLSLAAAATPQLRSARASGPASGGTP